MVSGELNRIPDIIAEGSDTVAPKVHPSLFVSGRFLLRSTKKKWLRVCIGLGVHQQFRFTSPSSPNREPPLFFAEFEFDTTFPFDAKPHLR